MPQLFRYAVFFLGGVLLASLAFLLPQASEPHKAGPDQDLVYRAIVNAADLPIAQPRMNCEFINPKKSGHVVVADFVQSYLVWSQNRSRSGFSELVCDKAKPQLCSWHFGESKVTESWSRSLQFQYDTRLHAIIPTSLSCLDVP